MIRNYINIALRTMRKQKVYFIVNLLGLSLGVTAFLVSFALVSHLRSFDRYHEKADITYRLVTHTSESGREYHTPGIPAVLPASFLADFQGISHAAFISGGHDGLVSVGEAEDRRFFQENGFAFTNGDFFQVFDRALILGNKDASSLLKSPNEVVLSERAAKKFFGKTDVVGELINLRRSQDYLVVAVMEDFPTNTDFPFDLLFSYENLKEERERGGWFSIYSDDHLYLSIPDQNDVKSIEAGLPAFVEKYLGDKNRESRSHHLQSLSSLHFDDRYTNFSYQTVNENTIMAIWILAIFLVITACINFINLSTALSANRTKEVGLRKVMGSSRGQIIVQFLTEAGLITFLALIVSLIASNFLIDQLNAFLQTGVHFHQLFQTSGLLMAAGLWLLVTLFAGYYPSLSISSLNPTEAFRPISKGKNSGSILLRRALVVFQFGISQVFIIATLVLIYQMHFLKNTDMGFKKDAVLTMSIPEYNEDKTKIFAERLRQIPGVLSASLSYTEPASSSISATNVIMSESSEEFTVHIKPADEYYLDTYGLELLAGENLIPSDTINRYLVTASFAKKAGFEDPSDIIGKYAIISGKDAPIVGVVKDFHTISLKNEMEPTILFTRPRFYSTIGVKVNYANMEGLLSDMKNHHNELYPEFRFEYQFLDEKVANFYEGEQRMMTIFSLLSLIAITIGCIGLYGLVSFMAQKKHKEMGVRKILGASENQILLLFSKDFVYLLLLAFLFAAPLAAYVMNQWLANFAYRIPLDWQIFAASLFLTFLIAILTVGYRSIQAARSNPVQALKSE